MDAEVAYTRSNAVKHTTKRNILCQLKAYRRFCDRFELPYFPADNNQICRFGQFLARTFESPESVSNYLSGIRTCHSLLGMEPPDVKDKHMQWFIQGLKYIMMHAVKQATPITPQILLRISRVVNYLDQIEMVSWVATLVGFTMFLRQSNLVPTSMDSFDPKFQFRRADLHITNPLQPMMAEIRWSKTNQFRNNVLRLPVLPTDNKVLCPVLWTHFMMHKIPAQPDDAMFTIYMDGKKQALSTNQLLARLRSWLKLVGLPEEDFTLHSLRRGGATFAHQCNIQGQMIQKLGGWASDAYKKYIDVNLDDRFEAMQLFVDGLNKLTC